MRHGPAGLRTTANATRDSERALTAKGIKRVREIAAALRRLEVDFDLILTSPFRRARQTAEIVAEELGLSRRLHDSPHLAIPPDSAKLLSQLDTWRPKPARVLLVGHEPHLSELAALLIAGGPGPALVFKKGGLARLDAQKLETGRCARLIWLLTPKVLRRLCER